MGWTESQVFFELKKRDYLGLGSVVTEGAEVELR